MKLEVGAWNKLPHYVVVGSPLNFYVWVAEGTEASNTSWFKGSKAFSAYNKLLKLNKRDLVTELKRIHLEGTL